MADVSTISEILAEAPTFIKVLEDGVAVFQAIEAKNFGAIVTALPAYETDVVAAYNAIKALGAAQAAAPVS